MPFSNLCANIGTSIGNWFHSSSNSFSQLEIDETASLEDLARRIVERCRPGGQYRVAFIDRGNGEYCVRVHSSKDPNPIILTAHQFGPKALRMIAKSASNIQAQRAAAYPASPVVQNSQQQDTRSQAQPIPISQPTPPDRLQSVVNQTPQFNKYLIGQGTPYPNTNLTAVTVRPANLFFEALLGPDATTKPGSNDLFAFQRSHEAIQQHIFQSPPNQVVSFTARGHKGQIRTRGQQPIDIADLGTLYGNATCSFSYQELQSTLQSQKIYTSPLLPLPFYRALKYAMQQDKIITLPGTDQKPKKIRDCNTPSCQALIMDVKNHPANYGLTSAEYCQQLLDLTFYQLGALVIKTEDFRVLMDANGKIRSRNPGEQDAIRLINACGIRGLNATPSPLNQAIMQQTFQTALHAAEKDFVVFPAVGMGVWGGDPNLYWRAFLDAVVTSGHQLEQIFVNPGHQTTTTKGPYEGCNGNEFQIILDEYRRYAQQTNNVSAIQNLSKIINLFDQKTDVLHLSHQLKTAFPHKIVSLFNASDPDVTLGNHVGEYVNNLDHPPTTEENYTACGTNGLCFETITGVHKDVTRLVQDIPK